ncbi:MAG TPA: alpha/beta hydrolase, partial [Stellaceae bacterium]|nr:alpha/beta hydrolase [Stellaceae bacterium]
MSSRAALPLLKSGLLPWRPELALQGGSLSLALNARLNLRGLSPAGLSPKSDSIDAALDGELTRRAALFLDGVERYRRHPYRRALEDPPLLWQEGTTRLLDYRPRGGPPVLVVPSL